MATPWLILAASQGCRSVHGPPTASSQIIPTTAMHDRGLPRHGRIYRIFGFDEVFEDGTVCSAAFILVMERNGFKATPNNSYNLDVPPESSK